MRIPVVLEVAPKRSFASALEWPGWSRAGRAPDDALAALIAYAPRYASVAKRAGLRFGARRSIDEIEVAERVTGGGSTEFGVPGIVATAEDAPVSSADLKRLVALIEACWATFDEAAGAAKGVTLTTGPRGGGRSLAKIRDHVRDAEVAYIGQLGARTPDPGRTRETFVAALSARVEGKPFEHPRNTRTPWPPRYAVRRVAWHVLDHAWEIEDRSARS